MCWQSSLRLNSSVPLAVSVNEQAEDIRSSTFVGPVSAIIAFKVNDVIRILNLTGTAEGLFIGNLIVEREEWLWFAFHPWSGFEFREVESGAYEHWVHRNEHWELSKDCSTPFQRSNLST